MCIPGCSGPAQRKTETVAEPKGAEPHYPHGSHGAPSLPPNTQTHTHKQFSTMNAREEKEKERKKKRKMSPTYIYILDSPLNREACSPTIKKELFVRDKDMS